jgi:hypothetical protein
MERLLVCLIQFHALVEFDRQYGAVVIPELGSILVDVLLAGSDHLIRNLDK